MDGDARYLGEALLHEVFQSGEDVVDVGNRKIALHHAVTRGDDVVFDLADTDVVAIDKFVVIFRHVIEEGFDSQFELAHLADADLRSGDVPAEGLDVDIDVETGIAIAEGADGIFQFGSAAMGFAQRKVFVDFEVEFDEKAAILLIGSDVVDGQTHSLGHRANGFEEMFVGWGTRLRVDHDVGGNNFANTLLDGIGELVDLLLAGSARDGDSGVDKMAIAGAPHADAFDAENTFHVADGVSNFVL